MILKRPIITESAYAGESSGKYYFWVDPVATKTQIKSAFEKIFGIKPIAINTSITHGRVKTNWKNRRTTSKSDRKKAIISVPKGSKLDILSLSKTQK